MARAAARGLGGADQGPGRRDQLAAGRRGRGARQRWVADMSAMGDYIGFEYNTPFKNLLLHWSRSVNKFILSDFYDLCHPDCQLARSRISHGDNLLI